MFDLCDQSCEHLLTNEWEFTAYCKRYCILLNTNGYDTIKCNDCKISVSRKLFISKYKGEKHEENEDES